MVDLGVSLDICCAFSGLIFSPFFCQEIAVYVCTDSLLMITLYLLYMWCECGRR